MALPTPTKRRRQTEALLCSQYVAENYPHARVLIQQYVGPIRTSEDEELLTQGEKLALGTGRRRADAVLILPDKIIVLECYVHVQLGKLSQLMTYLQLLPLTPELKDFVHLPVVGRLVGAQRDPILDQVAAQQNIEVVIFQPAWIVRYLETVDPRKSRDRGNVDLALDKAQ